MQQPPFILEETVLVWQCASCCKFNNVDQLRCVQCKKKKPDDTVDFPKPPDDAEITAAWKEHVDPESEQVYYFNTITGATQWERPIALGPAPYATGWYGRGAVNGGMAQEYLDRNKLYLSRPARKQKDTIATEQGMAEVTSEFNIWYGKFYGDYTKNNGRAREEPAPARCVMETDAGWTKADYMDSKARYFCLHFARGLCVRGKECQYFHRIPIPDDDRTFDALHDCFARERFKQHRDDMGGVGSFTTPSRTLYIGGLTKVTYKDLDAVKKAVHTHFSEWGEIENVNLIPKLMIAFVRFRLRSNCEFAKEAMAGQSLDAHEILNVRWANDDPNPVAQVAAADADRNATLSVLESRGVNLKQAPFEYPEKYDMPDPKRQCLQDEPSFSDSHIIPYPDTDHQYPDPKEKNSVVSVSAANSSKIQVFQKEPEIGKDLLAALGPPISVPQQLLPMHQIPNEMMQQNEAWLKKMFGANS